MAGKLDAYRVVFVDVDLTLINWPNDKPILDPPGGMLAFGVTVNLGLVKALKEWREAAFERELVVWSAGGAAHARAAVALAGMGDFVDAVVPKPHAFVDDNPPWSNARAWLSPGLD